MSAIGNIFWNIFDGQSAQRTHHEAFVENGNEARADVRNAAAYFKSPYTAIRDAYRAEPTQAKGWKKLGLGIATALAAVPLTVRGLLGGTFYSLLALKNGALDAAAHGVAQMFDSRNDPKPGPTPTPRPTPAPAPAPAPTPAPAVASEKAGRTSTPQPPTGGLGRVRIRVAQPN